MNYRQGNTEDLKNLKELATNSWQQFQKELTDENWQTLYKNISNDQTFIDLLLTSHCFLNLTILSSTLGHNRLVSCKRNSDRISR